MRACVRAFVRACVCVCACVRARSRVCMSVCVLVCFGLFEYLLREFGHFRNSQLTESTSMFSKAKCQSSFEPRHEISYNVVCATSKGSDQPAHTRSLIRAFASRYDC